MKRLLSVLCLPALLFGLLSSCTPKFDKAVFLPAKAAFETVADYVAVLYAGADADAMFHTDEGNRMILSFSSDGKALFNVCNDATLTTTPWLQQALRTVSSFQIHELCAEETGVYFWLEGYNNGIVYTTCPVRTRSRVKKKFRHRIYRLAKGWYCIGEHYI